MISHRYKSRCKTIRKQYKIENLKVLNFDMFQDLRKLFRICKITFHETFPILLFRIWRNKKSHVAGKPYILLILSQITENLR